MGRGFGSWKSPLSNFARVINQIAEKAPEDGTAKDAAAPAEEAKTEEAAPAEEVKTEEAAPAEAEAPATEETKTEEDK